MFKIYYFAEKSVKKSENIKIFLNSKANFFRIEKNLFFFNDRKKVSKILYNLITDYCYEINSFEKISLSLSLYFHSHNNLLNKICPINFIGKYEQFFLLKKMDIEVFKSFSDYLRNLYYALTDKKDENSFIYCLTSTVFEVLKTKYFTKYKNTKNFNQDRLRNFFNLEQFILYLNFLYNYDNGVFNMIRDKTMKKFFYENVFEIIYYFCNENFQMAILAINLGWQLYKNFHSYEEIIVEKFIILVSTTFIYYSDKLDINFIINELKSENDFHNYFFQTEYFSNNSPDSLKEFVSSKSKQKDTENVQDRGSFFSKMMLKNNKENYINSKGRLKEDTQSINFKSRGLLIDRNHQKNNLLEKFLGKLIYSRSNELHFYLICVDDLIDQDNSISQKNMEKLKEAIGYFFFEDNISENFYCYRNYNIPTIFLNIYQKIYFFVRERLVVIECEFNNLLNFYSYLTDNKKLKNIDLKEEMLFKFKELFIQKDSYYKREFAEEVSEYYKTLENHKINNPLLITLYKVSQNIKIQNDSDELIIKMLIYIYRAGYFRDEITMVVCYFSLFFPKNSIDYSLQSIIDLLKTLLDQNDSESMIVNSI